jgi:hypothetical protein
MRTITVGGITTHLAKVVMAFATRFLEPFARLPEQLQNVKDATKL